MNTILDIQHVSKSYGDNIALDDVSLSIPQGSIYGLLGPNGAGKTTLIRIINRIIYADKGIVYFNQNEMKDEDVHRIGYLPEERGLYMDMTVGDQLIYFGQLKGMNRAHAIDRMKFWFERLGMQDFGPKKVKELSKGMAQKVQFVLSVLHEPELVIFDEVFSGFDPVNANLIKDQILYLNENGVTILFSSHRMENVEELCTHAAMIHESHLVLNGSLAEIKDRYREGVFRVKTSEPVRISPEDAYEAISTEGNEALISIPSLQNTRTAIESLAKENNILVFEEVIPSLNDIFVKIVNHD